MREKDPPSKEACLQMAKLCHGSRLENVNDMSWSWLLCWVAYDDWIELYWEKK